MLRLSLIFAALFAVQHSFALQYPLLRGTEAYYNPLTNGGSMLDDAGPGPLGEPLNIIISALSSPEVLTDAGFLNFARAIRFSTECFGIHLGNPQTANLGDGHGWLNQTIELRQDYGDPNIGTCLESLIGGNHFRVYRQNGPLANSGALFLASSKEENVQKGHTIVPNGYNIGRDLIIATANGKTTFNGKKYDTTVSRITGLLQPGSTGINHGIAQDGIVALLTVTIV